MNTGKIRATFWGIMFCAVTGYGLSACNKGTEPGDVNVERSDIKEEGSLVGDKDGEMGEESASEKYEHHYDHADHPDSTALGDGAYKQGNERIKRP